MTYVNQSIVSKVTKAFAGEAKALSKARAEQDKAIQAHIDAMRIAMGKTPMAAFLKGNAAKNEARGEVKAMFDSLVTAEYIGASAGRNYQTSYWMAFEQNVPFQRDLFTSKPKAESKASDKKAGEVKSTTREALDKTLSKAIAQARLLGLTEFAAEMLDLCIESLDGFTEAE